MRYFLIIIGLIVSLNAKAEELATQEICALTKLEAASLGCVVTPLLYREGNETKQGNLIHLVAGTLFGEEYDGKDKYFLYTKDSRLLAIDSYKANAAIKCLIEKTGGSHTEFLQITPDRLYAIKHLRLEGDKVYWGYTGKNIFSGNIVANNESCTGSMQVSPEYLNWQEAGALCDKTLSDVPRNDGKTPRYRFLTLASDEAGYYYLCRQGYTLDDRPCPDRKSESVYLRINAERNTEPKAALIKKKADYSGCLDNITLSLPSK